MEKNNIIIRFGEFFKKDLSSVKDLEALVLDTKEKVRRARREVPLDLEVSILDVKDKLAKQFLDVLRSIIPTAVEIPVDKK